MTHPLDRSFSDRRGQDNVKLQQALIARLWHISPSTTNGCGRFYLEHYDAIGMSIDTQLLYPQTHQDICSLADFICSGATKTQAQLREDIIASRPKCLLMSDHGAAQKAIDVALPLLTMIHSRSWEDTVTLKKFIESRFKPSDTTIESNIELSFNAYTLKNIAAISLVWTSQLNDHLRLDTRSGELYVFRHATFLRPTSQEELKNLFPDGLLFETAETMAILFPNAEHYRGRWQRKIREKADVDVESGISCNVSHNLDHYHFWRDRLEAIQKYFDRSSPSTLRQWLSDKRDGSRFWTFWLTVTAVFLALVFGLIQSITGLVSVIR